MTLDTQKLIFAGSGPGSPWSVLGQVAGRILERYGYHVEVIRKPGPSNPVSVGSGEADLGAATVRIVQDAIGGVSPPHDRKWDNLRLIASVDWPQWLGVAIRRSLGVTSLDQLKERKLPLRVLARQDKVTERLFQAHGFSIADIQAWGGRVHRLTIPAEEIQMGGRHPDSKSPSELVKGDYVDLIVSPCWISLGEFGTLWRQASCFMDLRFLSLREDVIASLCKEFSFERETIPALTFEGVDEDVATVGEFGLVVYSRADLSPELAYLVAKAFEEHPGELAATRHHFSYNPRRLSQDGGLPVHAGAARFYRERREVSG